MSIPHFPADFAGMDGAETLFTGAMQETLNHAMRLALEQARLFVGSTAPNPPVGAAGLDAEGRVLSVQAHQKAGTGHAEARMIADCEKAGTLDRLHTVVVTLEPCNHTGRTPPCSEAILRTGARRVVFGVADPNPRVNGRGAERLRSAGLEVAEIGAPALREECRELIRPFARWVTTGLPWVTVKTAHRAEPGGSMIPPEGRKTFTSPSSLKLAHELRKRADAILTGSGTALADRPEFTIRHVADHPGKSRWLVVLDRRGRTPGDWIEAAESRGFRVRIGQELESELRFLGSQGVLEVLVEAGPAVSSLVLSSGFWNQHVVITQGTEEDRVEVRTRE